MRLKSTVLAVITAASIVIPSTLWAQSVETRSISFPTDPAVTYRDDFGEPRSGHAHEGIDMIGKKMMPLYAAVSARVRSVVIPEAAWGYAIVLEDSEGYTYHYIHVNNDTPGTDDGLGGPEHAYASGVTPGAYVSRGQLIGWMGDSGNAETAGAHLHFEIRRPGGSAMNPYASLKMASPSATTTVGGTSAAEIAIAQARARLTGVSPSTSSFRFTKTLALGNSGEEVRQLQLKLRTLRFFSYPSNTGFYGTVTRDAVIKFQRAQGLEPVGFVGPRTRGALNGT